MLRAASHASTLLFVPGDRPDRFSKAASSGADAVILDLEDAVAPHAKDKARAAAASFIGQGGQAIVRINAWRSPWFAHDVKALIAVGPAAIMLPKAEEDEALRSLSQDLPKTPLLALVETAAGFDNLAGLARAPNVCRLAFGAIDFQLDLGIEETEDELLAFRSQLVLRSRTAGLAPPLDGASLTIDDAGQLAVESRRARRLGFGGKLCIHPRQVAVVNDAFRPSEAEIEKARRIVQAAEASHGGAVAIDGRMVDRPVILMARETLSRARDRSDLPSNRREQS